MALIHLPSPSHPLTPVCSMQLADLHHDVLATVAAFLSIGERLGIVCRVSKQWWDAVKHPVVWAEVDISRYRLADANIQQLAAFWRKAKICPRHLLNVTAENLTHNGFLQLCSLTGISCLSVRHLSETHGASITPVLSAQCMLTTLSFTICNLCNITLPPLQHLRSLTLERCKLHGMAGLAQQPNLSQLAIRACFGVDQLALPPSITTLTLKSTITKDTLPPACPLVVSIRHLTSLLIFDTNIRWCLFGAMTDATTTPAANTNPLSSHPTFHSTLHTITAESLYLDKGAEEDMRQIAGAHNVHSLSILQSAIGVKEMRIMATMTALKSLHLNGISQLTDDGIQPIVFLRSLEVLQLTNVPLITEAVFKFFAQLPRLHTLDMRLCVGVARLASVQACAHLRSFHCTLRAFEPSSTPTTSSNDHDEDLQAIAHLSSLTTLCVDTPVSDMGMLYLSRLSHLTDLQLSGNADWCLTRTGFSHLPALCSLESLSLPRYDRQYKAECICALVQLPALRRVVLDVDNWLTEHEERCVRDRLPRLEELSIV